ncbi:MAG: outer membrane protein [Janthinobacterium lividum]
MAATAAGLLVSSPAIAAPFTGPTIFLAADYNLLDVDGSHKGFGTGEDSKARVVVNGGYDVKVIGRLTAGVELAGTIGDQRVCVALPGRSYCVDTKTEFSALSRVGYVLRPNILIFGEVGYATSRGRLTYTDMVAPRHNSLRDGDLSGLQLGSGVELALSKHSYARLNYRYTDFWMGLKENQLVGGVGLRF